MEVLKMNEFKACFQITKLVTFNVKYYTLGGNKNPYFSTSANLFFKNKKGFDSCGQCQERILPKGSLARKFYDKWDKKHLLALTNEELIELYEDVKALKNRYNHLYIECEKFGEMNRKDFSFCEIKELSKMDIK